MKSKYLRLVRLDNWIKNLLIFAPLFFGQQLFNVNLLERAIISFMGFSFIASGMYIINDYFDIEADKEHPVKKLRPLPSGEVSKSQAIWISTLFLVLGLVVGLILSLNIFYILIIYIALNALYNFKLKHLAIIDACTVSIMYIIRLSIGSFATGINLSMWIVLLTFFMALFISLAKRRDDVIYLADGIKTRKAAAGYNLEYLDMSMMLTSSIVIVSYIMFATSSAEINKIHYNNLYLTSFLVVLAILRYMQIILVEKKHGSPVKIFMQDRFIQIVVLGWVIAAGLIFYI